MKVRNTARERLENGEMSLGVGIRTARTVDIAKMMKTAGYDWLFIDLEHGPMSIEFATTLAVAALDTGISPIVRVPFMEHSMATRVLDNGALGIVMPHVDTAEQAREIVDHLKYPPVGHRSLAGAQAIFDFQRIPIAEMIESANAALLVIAVMETPTAIANGQLKVQRERGTDLTIFSPRAAGMGHHLGDATTSEAWASACNELIHRVCSLFPKNFIGVAMLPQRARVSPKNCVPEIDRCVNQYGFVGVNLNPDPSGGHWQDPPLGDRYWYPVYEKMVEYDIPAMIHVSASCNPTHHTTGAHYLNGDTAGFNQLMTSSVFKDFPTIKFIIPHGGGAVPYHWGRYRGLAQDAKLGLLSDVMLKNVFFDTCVYHLPGQELLAKVIPVDNILFASEMIGAVRGIDPETGHHYDDTKRYIDQLALPAEDKAKIFEGNARRVYGRLSGTIEKGSAGMV